ncbi:transcription factor bHLH112 isoform X3 [Morus notabilis]|uniref:transcription factor bHLH112 isoform X3 n=1 Tax=Morus notabilis TaxID=981085 RepID=UPI000CED4176|nr:transcription factor bHLH112 isoform X3 [Morus notabilis]
MAEEFQGGICGGNWWSSSRSVFMAASPCSVGLSHDVAGFGWPSHDMVDIKLARSSPGDTNSVCDSTSNNNIHSGFQEVQKPQYQSHDNINSVSGSGSSVLIDSTAQMMGFSLSTSDLNQSNNNFLNSGRAESNNIYSMLQEDMGTKLNYRQEIGLLDSSSTQIPKDFSGNCSTVTTSQALSAGLPVSSSPSYVYGSSTTATLLQSLFDDEAHHDHQLPQQNSFSNNNRPINYNNSSSTPVNYGSNNCNNNMVSSSWPRFSAPKQLQQQPGGLHFSNNTPFWNASEAAGQNNNNIIGRAGLFTSLPQQLQYVTPFEEKPKCNNFTTTKPNEDVQDSGSVVKKSSSGSIGDHHQQPVLKRARIETPSPLPTFKVRKEKLGDRITALQQLVSPFGKTDTASVLHEAIEYIKFLHDQVLSTPYMKNGASNIQVQQQGSIKPKDQEISPKQDLKSRGLCLVPISSTFPVANETTTDFWTPTFGGTFSQWVIWSFSYCWWT